MGPAWWIQHRTNRRALSDRSPFFNRGSSNIVERLLVRLLAQSGEITSGQRQGFQAHRSKGLIVNVPMREWMSMSFAGTFASRCRATRCMLHPPLLLRVVLRRFC